MPMALNEDGKKTTTMSYQQQKKLCTCSALFVHFFAVVVARLQRETFQLKKQLLVLRPYCCLCSCSLSFSIPPISTLMAANISHFLTTADLRQRRFRWPPVYTSLQLFLITRDLKFQKRLRVFLRHQSKFSSPQALLFPAGKAFRVTWSKWIRHRSEQTERYWENAVQGPGKIKI